MVKDMLKLFAFAKREGSTLPFSSSWLSGGATRSGIAQALFIAVEVLFLDKATVRLDSKTRHELLTNSFAD